VDLERTRPLLARAQEASRGSLGRRRRADSPVLA
jgi:hypothetical protein